MSVKNFFKILKVKNLNKIIANFEKIIITILVATMGLIVLFTTIELAIFILKELFVAIKEPHFLLDKKELLKIFAMFFNVLIGLELFETVRLYLKEDVFHAEFVILVALIAVARKVIILEYEETSYQMIIAIASIILVLAIGYYLVKRGQLKQSLIEKNKQKNTENTEN